MLQNLDRRSNNSSIRLRHAPKSRQTLKQLQHQIATCSKIQIDAQTTLASDCDMLQNLDRCSNNSSIRLRHAPKSRQMLKQLKHQIATCSKIQIYAQTTLASDCDMLQNLDRCSNNSSIRLRHAPTSRQTLKQLQHQIATCSKIQIDAQTTLASDCDMLQNLDRRSNNSSIRLRHAPKSRQTLKQLQHQIATCSKIQIDAQTTLASDCDILQNLDRCSNNSSIRLRHAPKSRQMLKQLQHQIATCSKIQIDAQTTLASDFDMLQNLDRCSNNSSIRLRHASKSIQTLKQLQHQIATCSKIQIDAQTTLASDCDMLQNLDRCSLLKQLQHQIATCSKIQIDAQTTLASDCDMLQNLDRRSNNSSIRLRHAPKSRQMLKQLQHQIATCSKIQIDAQTTLASDCDMLQNLDRRSNNSSIRLRHAPKSRQTLKQLQHQIATCSKIQIDAHCSNNSSIRLRHAPKSRQTLKQLQHLIATCSKIQIDAQTTLASDCDMLQNLDIRSNNSSIRLRHAPKSRQTLKQLQHQIATCSKIQIDAQTTLASDCDILQNLDRCSNNSSIRLRHAPKSRQMLKQLQHQIATCSKIQIDAQTTLASDCDMLQNLDRCSNNSSIRLRHVSKSRQTLTQLQHQIATCSKIQIDAQTTLASDCDILQNLDRCSLLKQLQHQIATCSKIQIDAQTTLASDCDMLQNLDRCSNNSSIRLRHAPKSRQTLKQLQHQIATCSKIQIDAQTTLASDCDKFQNLDRRSKCSTLIQFHPLR